ncbi:MAG TPA: hypothetical protein VII56_07790 [Rhizomicrobium sp.]
MPPKFPTWKSAAPVFEGSIRLWIVLDEYNQDVIGRSFYLEPEPPLGYFGKAFFLPLLQEFIRRRSRTQAIHRSR